MIVKGAPPALIGVQNKQKQKAVDSFFCSVFGSADEAGGSFGINAPRRIMRQLAAEGPRKAKKLISEQRKEGGVGVGGGDGGGAMPATHGLTLNHSSTWWRLL